jgi:hypothetical protein
MASILTDNSLCSVLPKAWNIDIQCKLLKLKLEDSSEPEKS